MVTIAKVHNVVQILPTKTKPKKLVFIGSDGKKYVYEVFCTWLLSFLLDMAC